MPALPASFLVTTTSPIQSIEWPSKPITDLYDSLTAVVPVGGLDDESQPFSCRLGWAESGVIVGVDVVGKTKRPSGNAKNPTDADGVVVCLDTRDTKSIRRGGRFCHRFRLTPALGKKAAVRQEPVPRAREDAKFTEVAISTAANVRKDGYRVIASIPGEALTGYDPSGSPRLGFFAELQDTELGQVPWSGDSKLPSDADPSLWQSLELVAA